MSNLAFHLIKSEKKKKKPKASIIKEIIKFVLEANETQNIKTLSRSKVSSLTD